MAFDAELKALAETKLREAKWTCQECGGNMPFEYEQDDNDETGYRINCAICDDCNMLNDSTINNEYGRMLDECSTRELLQI